MHARSLNSSVARHLNIPDFKVVLNPEWASVNPLARQSLREYIYNQVDAQSNSEVLNLDKIPHLDHSVVSISHCKKMGGFALVRRGISIGFDVELKQRVRSNNIHIVCVNLEEKRQAPHAAALWTAKEAAYKSLKGPLQPRGVADIEIGNWVELEKGTFQCEILSLTGVKVPPNRGLVIDFMEDQTEMTLSLFTLSSLGSVNALVADRSNFRM